MRQLTLHPLIIAVLQEPSLTVNGNSSNIIHIHKGEAVTVICDASGTRPEPELSWTINDHPAEEGNVINPSPVFSNLNFLPRHNDIVKCIVFLKEPNGTRFNMVTFHIDGKKGYHFYILRQLEVSYQALVFDQ